MNDIKKETEILEYAGFWIRVVATFIDNFLIMLLFTPIMFFLYGEEAWLNDSIPVTSQIIFSYLLPAIAVISFWVWKSATPGKMILNLEILDSNTAKPIKPIQAIIRYSGYFIAIIPLLIGIIWIAFDKRKQGWHDKLANTVVVKKRIILEYKH